MTLISFNIVQTIDTTGWACNSSHACHENLKSEIVATDSTDTLTNNQHADLLIYDDIDSLPEVQNKSSWLVDFARKEMLIFCEKR